MKYVNSPYFYFYMLLKMNFLHQFLVDKKFAKIGVLLERNFFKLCQLKHKTKPFLLYNAKRFYIMYKMAAEYSGTSLKRSQLSRTI